MAGVGTGKTRAADISVCLNSFTGAQTFIGVCGTFAGRSVTAARPRDQMVPVSGPARGPSRLSRLRVLSPPAADVLLV